MSKALQPELQLDDAVPRGTPSDQPNIEFLVKLLDGRDWLLSLQISDEIFGQTNVRWRERRIRDLAAMSKGRIAGGQKGYKLVLQMTAEEYGHYRNWMVSQANKMKQRVIESDQVFYGRKPVTIEPLIERR